MVNFDPQKLMELHPQVWKGFDGSARFSPPLWGTVLPGFNLMSIKGI
jgi:hypothetical protein